MTLAPTRFGNDGLVRMINYTIATEIHRCLGNRKDDVTIDGKAF